MEAAPELKPLKVRCGDAKCDENLHCFRPNRRKKNWQESYDGSCQVCGAKLVDWSLVKARALGNVDSVFQELQREFIRHEFFHRPFDAKSKAQAATLGFDGLSSRVREELTKRIGIAAPFRDGIQTPMGRSAIFYAQHATATCCRKCLEYWHDIARGAELTANELDYCEQLVTRYLALRKDELFDSGGRVAL